MSKIERNSNIELFRIIAILFIIAHHLLVHGLHLWQDATWANLGLLSLDSMFFVGVNVFVLISGYCGIKLRIRKLWYIYLMCAIIGGGCYLLHLFVDDARLGRSILYNTVFAISNAPGTWYIKVYFYLVLIAPILNAAIDYFDKKQHFLMIGSLTVINLYFGWYWQDNVNIDGYTLMNFVWLYFIGAYGKRYIDIKHHKWWLYCGIVIACSVLNAIAEIVGAPVPIWAYNNPFIVISSISFLGLFLSFDFENKYVNFLAQSTLGVYLIHENCYVSPYLYNNAVKFYSANALHFAGAVLCIYFVCVFVDVILRHLIVNPILKITPIRKRNNFIL